MQQSTGIGGQPLASAAQVAHGQAISTIVIATSQVEVTRTCRDFIQGLGSPITAFFLVSNGQRAAGIGIALDVDTDILLDWLVSEECRFTFQISVHIFNILAIHLLVTTGTHINLLDFGLGDVTLDISCFNVVIQQLITVLIQIGVVEVTNLLSRYLFKHCC